MQIFTDPDGNSLQQTDGETGGVRLVQFSVLSFWSNIWKNGIWGLFSKKNGHIVMVLKNPEKEETEEPSVLSWRKQSKATFRALPAWFYCG